MGLYEAVVRPAKLCGRETVAMTKNLDKELEEAEMKMLRSEMVSCRQEEIKLKMNTCRSQKYFDKARENRQIVWTQKTR